MLAKCLAVISNEYCDKAAKSVSDAAKPYLASHADIRPDGAG